ncbi:MAG: MaoC family dehydratase [Salinivirgaceae bacterium]|jgi:acyl dehydratase|nr:MaoC family dehydratase [Salinivirgaceae bacterium]
MSSQFGNYLEEFFEGQVFNHSVGKTITESDNNLFSLLTMNHHPVHLDLEFCKTHQHGQILVVGTLVFSLVVGFTVADISGKAIANLEYESVKHLKPVFIGDTLHAKTEVLEVKESKSKPDRGVIYVETIAQNQKGEKVLSFRRHVLISKKN